MRFKIIVGFLLVILIGFTVYMGMSVKDSFDKTIIAFALLVGVGGLFKLVES